ncbi:DUF3192 domain-containing protein [Glaciecola sp. HTCC2999]|uniref:DUF3192 domain-containing protein n=1 Tax=Glaciecola sp. HTCC2999 TaxID=455436 RepID=UPI0000E0E605|nr:DUF3192 domain-containing protein [Glaciecola sp. HTCC2999]
MQIIQKVQVISIASLLMVSLSGCVIAIGDDEYKRDTHHSSWEVREKNNRAHVQGLQLGEHYLDITNKMGVADFNELLTRQNNTYQVLYYRTHRQNGDGVTTKDECTPLVFLNNELVGWGDNYLISL